MRWLALLLLTACARENMTFGEFLELYDERVTFDGEWTSEFTIDDGERRETKVSIRLVGRDEMCHISGALLVRGCANGLIAQDYAPRHCKILIADDLSKPLHRAVHEHEVDFHCRDGQRDLR